MTDSLVEPERENLESLKRALRSARADPQYVPPEGAFHIDILTRLGEAFRWQDLEVLRLPFEGLTANVASPRTLYRMKRDTVRAKDRRDAEVLRRPAPRVGPPRANAAASLPAGGLPRKP